MYQYRLKPISRFPVPQSLRFDIQSKLRPVNTQDVNLTWENGTTYDWIQVVRNGIPINTLGRNRNLIR